LPRLNLKSLLETAGFFISIKNCHSCESRN
jgi:hypothetical protein